MASFQANQQEREAAEEAAWARAERRAGIIQADSRTREKKHRDRIQAILDYYEEAREKEQTVLAQDQAWAAVDEGISEETLLDVANKAAYVVETYLPVMGNITEDVVLQILSLYNQINPFGDTEFDLPARSGLQPVLQPSAPSAAAAH